MIYLCSPYSHSDVNVVNERVKQTTVFVNNHLLSGITVLSPVVYGHTIVTTCGTPSNWEFWERACRAFMAKCSDVWVLMLDGWQDSTGIKGEIEFAKELGLRIKYIKP
jgi:hypothetical protein